MPKNELLKAVIFTAAMAVLAYKLRWEFYYEIREISRNLLAKFG